MALRHRRHGRHRHGDLPAIAQGRLQGHRRLRPEPRPRQVARRAEGAGLRRSTPRSATSATGTRPSQAFAKVQGRARRRSTCWSTTPASRATACSARWTRDDWDAVIDTNLDSLFNVTKQVIDDMVERGWGRIINISSVNGEKGQFGQTNYSAAKAGMHGFTMALAQEVAKQGRDGQHRRARATSAPTWSRRSAKEVLDEDRRRASRSSASARRRRSPRSSPGSPRTNPASRPAPTSPSTAACTWADRGRARRSGDGHVACRRWRRSHRDVS